MFFMRRVNFDTLRLAHHTSGQLHDARRKRSAEHHGLLALDGELVDFRQVVGKTEVQHTVGFVHHQKLHLIQLDLQAALQIEQTAWRGHYQVGILQLGNLQLVRNTAYHVGNAQTAAMANQIDGVGANLLRQFTGRAQNQCAGGGRLEVACVRRVFALGFFQRCFAACNGFSALPLKFSFFVTLGLLLLHQ